MEGDNIRKRKQPTRPPFARLVAADELGLLRVVDVPAGPQWGATAVVQTWGHPDKSRAIHTLAAPQKLAGSEYFAVARTGGVIEVTSSKDGSVVCSIAPPAAAQAGKNKDEIRVPGLAFRPSQLEGSQQSPELVSCMSDGTLRVHRSSEGAGQPWEQVVSGRTAANVQCMALDNSGTRVAVGGEGCHLQIWSLAEEQGLSEVFKAKGTKPNKVGLMDLPNLTALTFLPSDPSGNTVLAGTLQHKLWLYDARAGKRPQMELDWGKARVTALAAQADGSRVWAANGAGLVEGLDLKARKMCGGALKGPAGSVRSLALHPAADGLDGDEGVDKSKLIASAGLDRMLRVHSTQSRAVQGKVYLKQQLTGVAWLPVPELEADQGEGHGRGGEADEEEDDEAGELQGAAGEAVGRGAGGRSKSKKEHKKDGSKKPRSK